MNMFERYGGSQEILFRDPMVPVTVLLPSGARSSPATLSLHEVSCEVWPMNKPFLSAPIYVDIDFEQHVYD